MINFINTGLDNRILKSLEHPQKVEKPILVHGKTKNFYRNQMVNVDINPSAKETHTNAPETSTKHSNSQNVNNNQPQNFNSVEEINQTLGTLPPDNKTPFGQWFLNLDTEEIKAIKLYTGSLYKDINSFLRKTTSIFDSNTSNLNLAKRVAPVIQSGIDKFVLSQPITVYRKMNKKDIELFKEGYTIKDLGFTSTTPIRNSYNPYKYKSGCIDLIITVPAGTGVGAWIAPISGLKRENEFLLNCNTNFKVNSVKSTMNGYEVKLEVVPKSKDQPLQKSQYSLPDKTNPSENTDKFSWNAEDILVFKTDEELKQWEKDHQ